MSRNAERVVWIMVGAAVGAGIGAGIALLYAPRTGRETRRYLRKRAGKARDMIVEAADTVRGACDSVAGAGRDAYDTVVDAGREAYKKSAAAASGAADIFERGRRFVAR